MGLTHSKGKREKHSRVKRERERTYSHAPGGLRVTKGISHEVLLLLLYIRRQGICDRLGHFSRVIRIVCTYMYIQGETIRNPIKTFREFSRYVGRMANRKASGDDKMPADLFKMTPEAFRKRAWILNNIILVGHYVT